MTIFGWDASHYDAPPTRRDGIDFYTHKCAEGHHFYKDGEYQAAMNAARSLGVPVLGAYFVNHPGTVADQADWWVSIVEGETPWWREVPFVWQIDAEKFSYMSRAPNLAEIDALGDAVCQRAKVPASSVIVYAPKWLYGDTLRGLKFRLWASNYGSNPTVPYRDAYPGDTSSRWGAYSGQAPLILQYGSRTTIAGQTTCDANAFKGTLAQLRALLTGGDDMSAQELLDTELVDPLDGRPHTVEDYIRYGEFNMRQQIQPVLAALAAAEAREVARDAAQTALIQGLAAVGGTTMTAEQLAALTAVVREAATAAGQVVLDRLAASAKAEADALAQG